MNSESPHHDPSAQVSSDEQPLPVHLYEKPIAVVRDVLHAQDVRLQDEGNGWAIVATIRNGDAWVWVADADHCLRGDPDEADGWTVGIYQGSIHDSDFTMSVYLTALGADLDTLHDLLLDAHAEFVNGEPRISIRPYVRRIRRRLQASIIGQSFSKGRNSWNRT